MKEVTPVYIMYDSATNSQFPSGAYAYASYVDGSVADQPNYPWVSSAFPGAHHLSIALFADHDADCLDVEPGAAAAGQVPGWVARQRARGVSRPCIYASVSRMRDEVMPALSSFGISFSQVRLWSAHYGAGEHICGPATCKQVPRDMDGTQWTDCAQGKILDQSLILGTFFGGAAPAPPGQWTEYDMAKLAVLRLGDKDQPGEFFSVHRLQALLREAGKVLSIPAAVVEDDGDFGPLTAAAVDAIQAHYQLSRDGIVGSQTWGVLLTGQPS